MSKRKLNIRPELVGELFLKPSEDIPYRLISCDTEPRALMAKVTDIHVPNMPGLPISDYQDFVLLKPVRPITKLPEPRKPRSDIGTKHRKPPVEHSDDDLVIHIPEPGKVEPYRVKILDSKATGETLRETIEAALARFGGKLPTSLAPEKKAIIQGILDAGK